MLRKINGNLNLPKGLLGLPKVDEIMAGMNHAWNEPWLE
jgi:hypothetical protein